MKKTKRIDNLKISGARTLFGQMIFPTILVLVTALGSWILMTWIVQDKAGINSTYKAAWIEIAGTLGIMALILVPLNLVRYFRRVRELRVLSEAIGSVADGNFGYRINTGTSGTRGSMLPVYRGFNKMCEELESVRILKDDFINSYSHEFKTPIASINGFADLLLTRDLGEEERDEYLRIIRDESARLSRLTHDTLVLSRLSALQIIPDLDTYDLGEQIRQCSIILSRDWLEKKITFSGEFIPAMYRGNREIMQHLWLNLLGNAVKYTPSGGEISVVMRKRPDGIETAVADTGIGMSEETAAHLFEAYYRGDESHSEAGLGLGLAVVKRILELCGGTISVESKLDVGSTFTVFLPVSQKNAREPAA